MKNILIIIGKLYIGGAEKVGRDIGYYADKTKYRIHYIVFEEEVGAYEKELEETGCIIHHLASPSSGYKTYYNSLVKLIKEEHIDVIHSHTMFSSGWAMLAGKVCKVPVRIAHSHTIRGPEKRNLIKTIYEKTMRRIIIHNATDLVACGKSAGEWFYGKRTFEKRGQLIYNGIGLKEFTYSEEARSKLRREKGFEDSFVIGNVGHLATVKNQSFLIKLMPDILKQKPNAVLLLLGEGEDRKILTKFINTLNLQKNVILTGNVPNVGEYMNAMDVFVFPSLYEGMPLAMVEAQTNGLPCVISDKIPDDVHLTELISSLSIENADEWVQKICNSKRDNPQMYGKKIYDMGFDTISMLEKVYKLYEKMSMHD